MTSSLTKSGMTGKNGAATASRCVEGITRIYCNQTALLTWPITSMGSGSALKVRVLRLVIRAISMLNKIAEENYHKPKYCFLRDWIYAAIAIRISF